MELSQLTAYAKEKYAITEEFKWESFKGFSVLSHPATGKWAAGGDGPRQDPPV